jgi:hypothetical protein
MEIGSREAIREAVEKGIGIAVVSEAEFVPHERLAAMPVSNADAHVVCLEERRSARLLRAFLEVVDGLLATRARSAGARRRAGAAERR